MSFWSNIDLPQKDVQAHIAQRDAEKRMKKRKENFEAISKAYAQLQKEDEMALNNSRYVKNFDYMNAQARPCTCLEGECRVHVLNRNDKYYLHDSRVVHTFVQPTQEELNKYRRDDFMLLKQGRKGNNQYFAYN